MNCENPIFIVGAPRSGTTLLRSMIDAHPKLCCPPWETGIFDRLSAFARGDFEKPSGPEANFCPLKRLEVLDWMRDSANNLMSRLVQESQKPRWGEKTPAHVFQIELILEIYPKAQFIHIIRNGNDVVKSLQNVTWAPGGIRWSVQRWIDSVTAGREATKKFGQDKCHEVRFEELTANPNTSLRTICSFLGEQFSDTMLDFHRPEKNSWGLGGQEIQKSSINQHKYRELNFVERFLLKKRAGDLLNELGY